MVNKLFPVCIHNGIIRDLLCEDGINLTKKGTDILVSFFVDNISNFVFKYWNKFVHNETNTSDTTTIKYHYLPRLQYFSKGKNLVEITKSCKRNPRIACLNINSLRNKIRLKEITKSTATNFVSLNENFPDSEFNLENYQFTPIWKDKDSYRVGVMIFIRKNLITKMIKTFTTKLLETILLFKSGGKQIR